jgi:hypothetical protein
MRTEERKKRQKLGLNTGKTRKFGMNDATKRRLDELEQEIYSSFAGAGQSSEPVTSPVVPTKKRRVSTDLHMVASFQEPLTAKRSSRSLSRKQLK